MKNLKEAVHDSALLQADNAFIIGEAVYIQTVTYHLTGRIIGIKQQGDVTFLLLDEAAWQAISARWTQTIDEGQLDECEPVSGIVRVSINAIVLVYEWRHPLPRQQK